MMRMVLGKVSTAMDQSVMSAVQQILGTGGGGSLFGTTAVMLVFAVLHRAQSCGACAEGSLSLLHWGCIRLWALDLGAAGVL